MSYEAVPCMVRAPSQDGTKGTILGVIIRPSSSQEGTNANGLPTPPGVIPIKGAKSIVIQPGSKRSLIISNDQIQKMVNGRGVRMSPHSLWSPLPISSTSSSITPQLSITSPQSMDMGLSPPSSIRLHSAMDGIASSTPDSGIQSVPTTPPQTSHNNKSEERADEETKFDDMPRLRPMDEEEATTSCSSSHPPALEETPVWHGSECETSLPSSLTNTSWNPEEIATQLLSMAAFDPRKIQEVTALMLQRSKEDVDKKGENDKKRKNEKIQSPIEKKKFKRDYLEWAPSTSKEGTMKSENRDLSEEECKRSEEEPLDEESRLVMYRLAIRRRINHKVEETSDRVIDSLSRLSIGDHKWKKREGSINPLFSPIQWETINARKRSWNVKGIEGGGKSTKVQRKKREEEKKNQSKEPTKKLKRRGESEMDNYQHITNNVYLSGVSLPSVSSSLFCHCTRGGCLSPADCINRSRRVFCTPSSCRLPSCSNRLSSSTTLFVSKGILKTKEPKKANEFLGEMVGEVCSVSCISSRLSSLSPSHSRCFAFTSNHFIDCTSKGNITRFVRHSCTPNSTIQIWWESGVPHLCLFSLFPIASNSDISVDLSFLTPFSFDCQCSSRGCHRCIPSSLSLPLHQSILHPSTSSQSLFLPRNLRECTRKKRVGSTSLSTFYLFIDQKFRRIDGKVRREYASILQRLRLAAVNEEKETFVSLVSDMQQMADSPVDTHSLSCIRNRLIRGSEQKEDEKERKKSRKNEPHPHRYTDISYLDVGVPVGSYNADEWNGESVTDAVRCVCGSLEDDGEMVECEKCHFWLHSDCIHNASSDVFSICPLCVNCTSTPYGDVPLRNQPDIRLDGCTYYRALENRSKMQIRLNECVYVRKLKSDKYKRILRGLESKKGKGNVACLEDSHIEEEEETIPPRSLLRVFRVERLFETSDGHRFLFGFYYARPHETFCDENRMFHPNEVFSTPFYDTLPLNSVVGKCVVLEATLFCQGRPLFPSYKEHDVFVCEYQLDRNQRHFDKCKNSYFINTSPYAFQKFERARSLQRIFTPFTYASPTIGATGTPSQEKTGVMHQQSAKRIDTVLERLTSIHV